MASPRFSNAWTRGVVISSVLGVFAALVCGLTLNLRSELRSQMLLREADAIHAVAQMQLDAAQQRLVGVEVGEKVETLYSAVLESSRLKGVLSIRLFDEKGVLRNAMPFIDDVGSGKWWPTIPDSPMARFSPGAFLESAYSTAAEISPDSVRVPLLEVVVPLRDVPRGGQVIGVAQYWIHGASVEEEFKSMDQKLAWQAGLAFFGAAAVVILVLAWAFDRLEKANRLMREQGIDLARANQELDFSAKMNAIGAISAHLIHGLNNPLVGLEGYTADKALSEENSDKGEAWLLARDSTRRLRGIINEVLTLLRDEAGGSLDYTLTSSDILEMTRKRCAAAAASVGVEISLVSEVSFVLPARTANLVGLVLYNLANNAIYVSPLGSKVVLEARKTESRAEFLVSDQGSGIPDAVRGCLFQPKASTKEGGSGMGLAISSRLARHAGGCLELLRSDTHGTVFQLWLS